MNCKSCNKKLTQKQKRYCSNKCKCKAGGKAYIIKRRKLGLGAFIMSEKEKLEACSKGGKASYKKLHAYCKKEKIGAWSPGIQSMAGKISIQRRKTAGLDAYGYNKEQRIKNRALRIIPLKDTSIEIKIQNFLKAMNIEFLTHQYMKEIEHGYQCDIFIPSMKLIIECDGDYWHGNRYIFPNKKFSDRILKQIEVDKIRTKELNEKGYKVIRLWENKINEMDINNFNNIIKEVKEK